MGIDVTASSVQITGNTITGSGGAGITIAADDSSVAGNLVTGNAGNGIVVDGSDNRIGVRTDGGRPSARGATKSPGTPTAAS